MSRILLRDYEKHTQNNLTFTFIDADSQKRRNLLDPVQQNVFKNYTDALWSFAIKPPEVKLRTIDQVLLENRRLHDSVEEAANVNQG